MHYYNGQNAAKRIGISYKTLLRWIEKGKIRPEEAKTPTGQLVISGDQVEAARLEVLSERTLLGQTETSMDIGRQPEIDTDLLARVQELERRVQELESTQRMSVISPVVSEPVPTTQYTSPPKVSQNRK